MIFSNRIYKISSGKNPMVFADNENNMTLTIFKSLTEEKQICFSPVIKCLNTSKQFGYNKVIKLNDEHNLICMDKYISVVENIL